MRQMFVGLVGEQYAGLAVWVAAILIVAIVLFVFYRIARRYASGTFVMGGKNRKARLAVMDATAVDGHRRLVLVRRDDIEHLILIGGPTDVVVEQNIRLSQSSNPRPVTTTEPEPVARRQPSPPAAPPPAAPASRESAVGRVVMPAPPIRPRTVQPIVQQPAAPQDRPQAPQSFSPSAQRQPAPSIMQHIRANAAAASVSPASPPPVRVAPAPNGSARERTIPMLDRPAVQPPADRAGAQDQAATPAPDPARREDPKGDDALMRELEVTLDEVAPAPTDSSLEDEMTRLLGDMSDERR